MERFITAKALVEPEILIEGCGNEMEKSCDVSLVTFFGDLLMMASLECCHNFLMASLY